MSHQLTFAIVNSAIAVRPEKEIFPLRMEQIPE